MRHVIVSILVLCLLITPAWPQGASLVYDAQNHVANLLQAARELIVIQNQIQDLAALIELGPFLETIQQAADMVNQVQAIALPLIARYQRWAQFMGMAKTRCNPYKLNAWIRAFDHDSDRACADAAAAKPAFATAGASL
jgi:conjugal transfer/entry exclusion protein